MKRRFVPKLSFANVIACIALFVALGGAAVAAGLPRKSVGAQQLKKAAVNANAIHNGAVTPKALRKGAVTAGKIAPGAVVAGKLGANAVLPGNLGNGVISTAKIAGGAVVASTIKNGVITNNKLQNESVNAAKLAKGSVTLSKLGPEIAPLYATLRSGQTIRGVFDVGGTAANKEELANGSVNFQFPLANTPNANVLAKGSTNANCSGLGSGDNTPAANGGNLCIYITEAANADASNPLTVQNNSRLGFGLVGKAKEAGTFAVYGVWAVTAP
jgi:hypothetical protein